MTFEIVCCYHAFWFCMISWDLGYTSKFDVLACIAVAYSYILLAQHSTWGGEDVGSYMMCGSERYVTRIT